MHSICAKYLENNFARNVEKLVIRKIKPTRKIENLLTAKLYRVKINSLKVA